MNYYKDDIIGNFDEKPLFKKIFYISEKHYCYVHLKSKLDWSLMKNLCRLKFVCSVGGNTLKASLPDVECLFFGLECMPGRNKQYYKNFMATYPLLMRPDCH